jgi:hypothetical protein
MTAAEHICSQCGDVAHFSTTSDPRCFRCGGTMRHDPDGEIADRILEHRMRVTGSETPEEYEEGKADLARWRRNRIRVEQIHKKRFVDMSASFGRDGTPSDKATAKAAARYDYQTGEWLKTCPVCGAPFRAKRSDAATCSPACRQKRARANR